MLDGAHAVTSVVAGSLVGRDALVDRVVRLVADGARLVTLRGTVGVGKARVATEVAARLVADRVARTSRRAVLRELDDRAAVERAIEGA
ncbi:MAG: hypothetical protein IT379_08600, partial [Deltaproteobacteria bacterium]|nr:hypothetical protein [Deltaproteobacteria bacterium]